MDNENREVLATTKASRKYTAQLTDACVSYIADVGGAVNNVERPRRPMKTPATITKEIRKGDKPEET